MSIVTANLRRIINEKGYKMIVVARNAGINQQTFYNIMHGKSELRAEHIPGICKAIGCEPNDLFEAPDMNERRQIDDKGGDPRDRA